MKYILYTKARFTACLLLLTIIVVSCGKSSTDKNYTSVTVKRILQQDYSDKLQTTIGFLEQLEQASKQQDKEDLYKKARLSFKATEPYLAFFDKNNYKSLNAPNILKVDEEDATNIKLVKPFGFQMIEELLYDNEVEDKELKKIVTLTKNRLKLVAKNNSILLKDYHLLWLLRSQIAQTALTGITGFDSPVLEQSLEETKEVYNTLNYIISASKQLFNDTDLFKSWREEFKSTIEVLEVDFTSFDRYSFIKNHTHKQLELLVQTAKDWNVSFPLQMALNDTATSLFSENTLNIDYFSDHILKNDFFDQKSALGKQLFNDKRFSKNQKMSCASCHHKDKAFTDGLVAFRGQQRNTPTLTYASFQRAFFHDGRAGSLEGQVVSVVRHAKEFNTSLETIVSMVKSDAAYVQKFQKLYGKVDDMVIRNAIATYIKSLNKFNSKFDQNINGKENTLTEQEIKGFNLFMGKAKCATCHFPPVFNGTVPPNYTDTELEAIGVPNHSKTALSSDLGRYSLFNTPERKHFFKTPTVRNITLTAPYMHNGTYKTLEEVMDFYNKGGGVGMGFQLDAQTLPSDNLELSEQEISDVIAFMKTLTDR